MPEAYNGAAGKGFEIALRYLTGRAASSLEVARMLRRKGVDPAETAEVVRRLEGIGYIDDRRFATEWASLRCEHRGSRRLGREGLKSGLIRRGIEPRIAADVVDEVMTEEQELRAATELAARRAVCYTHLEPEARQRRLWSYLARRGFRARVIAKALGLDDQDMVET
ncbi:MAG: regulatory protein RecX [Ignavibacteriales bacterium]